MEKCFLVVRSDSYEKAKTSLSDVVRHGKLKISTPKILQKKTASLILKKIIDVKEEKDVNILCFVYGKPEKIIGRVKKIHPPAHIVVVTKKHVSHGFCEKIYPQLEILKGYYKPKG